jgi:hypothetical protein
MTDWCTIDDDEINDDRNDDDVDDDDTPLPPPLRPPLHVVLDTRERKADTWVFFDAKGQLRIETYETYPSVDDAKTAHERLKAKLLAEGYKES